MVEPKKVMEEKKTAGISLPTSEMTFAWMEDDAAMGAIDTDDEMEEVKDKKPAFLQQTASGRTPKVASRYAEFSKQALIYAPVYGVICEINLPVPAL